VTQVGEGVNVDLPGGSSEPATEETDECEYWRENHTTDYGGPDSKFVTSTQIAPVDVAFRLEANLRRRNIRITSIFRWGTVAADVTNAQKRRTIRKFKSKVAGWSGRYRMKITDPDCGEKTLPIRFRLLWSPDDTADTAPYQVNLYKTYPRAGVTGWDVDIGYDSDVKPDAGWVLAHEYGHTLCLADEYFYAGVTSATVVYKKADSSTFSVALEPAADNIMKTHANRRYKKRFFFFAAIEAQELLRRESGQDVTCEIV
jgi:hypothetical protein